LAVEACRRFGALAGDSPPRRDRRTPMAAEARDLRVVRASSEPISPIVNLGPMFVLDGDGRHGRRSSFNRSVGKECSLPMSKLVAATCVRASVKRQRMPQNPPRSNSDGEPPCRSNGGVSATTANPFEAICSSATRSAAIVRNRSWESCLVARLGSVSSSRRSASTHVWYCRRTAEARVECPRWPRVRFSRDLEVARSGDRCLVCDPERDIVGIDAV